MRGLTVAHPLYMLVNPAQGPMNRYLFLQPGTPRLHSKMNDVTGGLWTAVIVTSETHESSLIILGPVGLHVNNQPSAYYL